MKLLEIIHPAAKTLVDISLSQDAEVPLSATVSACSPWLSWYTLDQLSIMLGKFGLHARVASSGEDGKLHIFVIIQVGDGTTTVVILAGEFLRESKPFVEEGVHPQSLIRSFRQAGQLAVQQVKDLSISIEGKSAEEKADMLKKCAMTSLNSKLVRQPDHQALQFLLKLSSAVAGNRSVVPVNFKSDMPWMMLYCNYQHVLQNHLTSLLI